MEISRKTAFTAYTALNAEKMRGEAIMENWGEREGRDIERAMMELEENFENGAEPTKEEIREAEDQKESDAYDLSNCHQQ